MAIDTAAKRRNVSRMMQLSMLMGLAPSSGLDTDDRVNAARAYVGLSYTVAPAIKEYIRFHMQGATRGILLKVK